jgi:hypothetical protein
MYCDCVALQVVFDIVRRLRFVCSLVTIQTSRPWVSLLMSLVNFSTFLNKDNIVHLRVMVRLFSFSKNTLKTMLYNMNGKSYFMSSFFYI